MREILFRGKSIDDDTWAADVGDWVYGGYVPPANKHLKKYFIGNMGICTEVNPETIGQFTGLTDRNGKKIFEGDIVEFQFDNDDCPFPDKNTKKRIGRVYFEKFRASFAVTRGRNGSSVLNNDLFRYVQNGNRVSVIGNVHDNPELLKGGDTE